MSGTDVGYAATRLRYLIRPFSRPPPRMTVIRWTTSVRSRSVIPAPVLTVGVCCYAPLRISRAVPVLCISGTGIILRMPVLTREYNTTRREYQRRFVTESPGRRGGGRL
eukprot:3228099-Rhodomonas_salina.4